MTNNLNASTPAPSSPEWQNWTGNLIHHPPSDGANYYFTPTNLTELQKVLTDAKAAGVTVRVSGQRHSQSPLVTDDNRDATPPKPTAYLVDMSCYQDLGGKQDQRIVLGPGKTQVTVNAGVREDELDTFLTQNNLMFQTVTAGGFFSLGGMTAVDVHGGTIDAPIFAETVAAFTILRADGSVMTIDRQTPKVGDWSPLQFARVSLGGLGIVTSMTLDVLARPSPTTLQGGTQKLRLTDRNGFIQEYVNLLKDHTAKGTRLETFFTPYAAPWPLQPTCLVLWWNLRTDNPSPNTAPTTPTACDHAEKNQFGAPIITGIGQYGADAARAAQLQYSKLLSSIITAITAFEVIQPEVDTANKAHSELWLTEAVPVIFMSYYLPLPGLDAAGLKKVWDGLDVVSQIVTTEGKFHISAPMEFRFVKGGDTAMSATFTDDPANTWFINLDLIGFVEKGQKPADYPPELLQFFADVERQWVETFQGFPHQGKMYGFYDPTAAKGTHTAPFNPNFLADLRRRRGVRLQAYNAYRKSLDPNGLFYNPFLKNLLGD